MFNKNIDCKNIGSQGLHVLMFAIFIFVFDFELNNSMLLHMCIEASKSAKR